MWWLVVAAFFLLALPILRGAPWLPTRRQQVDTALDLLDLSPGDLVVDLGVGTGAFSRAAARRGLRVEGYEINPLLFLWAKVSCWKSRSMVKIVLGDFWLHSLPSDCSGVYVFLIDHYMLRLNQKLDDELRTGSRVVSYIFKLPNRKEAREKDGLYLYYWEKQR